MTDLPCKRCGHVFKSKSNLLKHLRRKFPCDAKLEDITIEDYITSLLKRTLGDTTYDCTRCSKPFSTRHGKHQHMKHCKGAETSPTSQSNNITINNNNNNSHNNNTTNYNITVINDFKNVDGSHISSKDLIDFINSIRSDEKYYDVFQKLLTKIYFDKNHPENHTFTIPNKKENRCHVIANNKVKYDKKSLVTDIAINETRNTLHDEYDDNSYDYSMLTQQTMNKMDEKYKTENKGHMHQLRDDTELTILNNKDTVQGTWRDLGITV